MRQWLRYQRQSLKYQKELTDNIYFRNVNNNAGIFDYMIGAAEEQECKEAFLAYYSCARRRRPRRRPSSTDTSRPGSRSNSGLDVDFEVDDALAKLERLDLLRRDGERLSVPPPEEALARLDDVWDGFFQFNVASPATAAEA